MKYKKYKKYMNIDKYTPLWYELTSSETIFFL